MKISDDYKDIIDEWYKQQLEHNPKFKPWNKKDTKWGAIARAAHYIDQGNPILNQWARRQITLSTPSAIPFFGKDNVVKEAVGKFTTGHLKYGEADTMYEALQEMLDRVKNSEDKTVSDKEVFNILKDVRILSNQPYNENDQELIGLMKRKATNIAEQINSGNMELHETIKVAGTVFPDGTEKARYSGVG